MVGHVAGGKYPLDAGGRGIAFAAATHQQVAVAHLQLALEQIGIGLVADGDKHPGQCQILGFSAVAVLEAGAGHAAGIAQHFLQVLVPVQADIAIGGLVEQLVLENLLGSQLVAAMHQVHFFGDVRQVQCFLHGGVAAAHHGHHLIAVEEAIAGGAGGNPLAGKGLFGGQAQVLRRGASGDDQRVATVGAAVADEDKRPLLQLCGVDVVIDDLGVEAFGVSLHPLHQHRAGQAFDIAGPVVDFGGGGQLAAGLQTGDHRRFEVGPSGIDGSAVTGRARAQNDQA
ncbi:hypothetical protein BME99_20155 [Pseudomonas protegens]|nr:hypothetical protein BME99_20155 [Pseudomonas protegens]